MEKAILLLGYVIFLIVPIVNSSLCKRQCGLRIADGVVKVECDRLGFNLEQNCCYNSSSGNIYGLDLRKCNITDDLNHLFHEDIPFLYEETFIADLTQNDIESSNDSNSIWSGFVNLNKLYLPSSSFHQCPGGSEYWRDQDLNESILICTGQLQSCNISAISCPTHSECKTNGPGLSTCRCKDGFYGYKCRKTGTFPFTMYFSILLVSTVAVTVGLWFIERRLVLKHAKTN